MQKVRLLILGVSMFAPGGVNAEQGCSDGFYPGGTQPGGQICVPIPGYGTSGGANQAPIEQWRPRWGAIATDPSGKTGIAGNASSKAKAEKAALNQCKDKGGADCRVNISYRNSCGVLAWGGGFMAVASADTLSEASQLALGNCSKDSSECEIFFSNCSFPERIQ